MQPACSQPVRGSAERGGLQGTTKDNESARIYKDPRRVIVCTIINTIILFIYYKYAKAIKPSVVKHAITHVSEEAETLGEIKRLQPDFDLHTMSKLLEEEVVPGWVQAFLRGDAEGVEFMSKWSTQRAVEVSPAHPSQHGRLIDGLVCVCVARCA